MFAQMYLVHFKLLLAASLVLLVKSLDETQNGRCYRGPITKINAIFYLKVQGKYAVHLVDQNYNIHKLIFKNNTWAARRRRTLERARPFVESIKNRKPIWAVTSDPEVYYTSLTYRMKPSGLVRQSNWGEIVSNITDCCQIKLAPGHEDPSYYPGHESPTIRTIFLYYQNFTQKYIYTLHQNTVYWHQENSTRRHRVVPLEEFKALDHLVPYYIIARKNVGFIFYANGSYSINRVKNSIRLDKWPMVSARKIEGANITKITAMFYDRKNDQIDFLDQNYRSFQLLARKKENKIFLLARRFSDLQRMEMIQSIKARQAKSTISDSFSSYHALEEDPKTGHGLTKMSFIELYHGRRQNCAETVGPQHEEYFSYYLLNSSDPKIATRCVLTIEFGDGKYFLELWRPKSDRFTLSYTKQHKLLSEVGMRNIPYYVLAMGQLSGVIYNDFKYSLRTKENMFDIFDDKERKYIQANCLSQEAQDCSGN